MRSIFDVEQQRSAGRAVLFYLGHLIIALITGGCAGIMVGLTTHAESRHLASHYAGLLVGIIYSGVLCVSLIRRRNLALYYYGLVPLVLGIAAVFGGIAGLVIPAFLTTVDGQSQAMPVVPRQNAPTAHRGVFGQRVVGR
jgi:hypothetical protein